jgi:HK97 family phage portal protein
MKKAQPNFLKKALYGLQSLFRFASPFAMRAYVGSGGGWRMANGQHIDEQTATTITAVWACVRIIAQNIATIPIFVYKRSADGTDKKKYPQHALHKLIHDKPNRLMTAAIWKFVAVAHLCLWGNHFSLIDWLLDDPVSMWPLDPSRMRIVLLPSGDVQYEYATAQGTKIYNSDDILHLRIFSLDGIVGLSPIQQCKRAVGLSIAAEEFGTSLYNAQGRPSGTLSMEGELDAEGQKRLRESWEQLHSGQMGRVAILEGGMEYAPITMNMNDVQYIQNRKFQVQDIARIFGVPPHLIQEIDQPTYASVEAQKDEFLTFTLRPIGVMIEQDLNLTFLGGSDARYVAAFNFDAFLRSDVKTRYESYAIGINWGILSPNDCREKEDMNRVEGGDDYLRPLNMATSSGERAPAPSLTPPTPGAEPTPPRPKPKPNGSAVQ